MHTNLDFILSILKELLDFNDVLKNTCNGNEKLKNRVI